MTSKEGNADKKSIKKEGQILFFFSISKDYLDLQLWTESSVLGNFSDHLHPLLDTSIDVCLRENEGGKMLEAEIRRN